MSHAEIAARAARDAVAHRTAIMQRAFRDVLHKRLAEAAEEAEARRPHVDVRNEIAVPSVEVRNEIAAPDLQPLAAALEQLGAQQAQCAERIVAAITGLTDLVAEHLADQREPRRYTIENSDGTTTKIEQH